MKITMQNKKDITLREGFEEFTRMCEAKNLSKSTITFYNSCVKMFMRFYDENMLVKDISPSLIDDFIIKMKKNTRYNDISINTEIRGFRTILYTFMRLGYMDKFDIKLIKAHKKVKETYSDEELEILLKKPNKNKCSFVEYRTWVTINFLLATGVRISSIQNIKIEDLDFDNMLININKTKNRKGQVIPLSTPLANILKEYLLIRKGKKEDFLFCNINGGEFKTKSMQVAIHKYNKKRGVLKTSVHAFRHTFAKKWILSGGDIFRLQKILGHSSLEMVRNYVNMFDHDLQKDFDEHNPLSQFNNNGNVIRMGNGGRR